MSNTLDLHTGFTGEPHIDSSQQGLLHADIVGRDKYITQAGSKFAITMIDNNTVEIGTGAIFNQGRYIVNKAPVQLTIENGSQTLDRNVLICTEYSKNPSTLIEDANWSVVHGEPSLAPTDPDITEGNIFAGALTDVMKVYRIPFSKLTPGEPVLLVDTLMSLMDLKSAWDSISHIGKVLWSGSLSSGSITVPELSDFVLFCIMLQGVGTPLLCFSLPTSSMFRGNGGDINTTPAMTIYAANLTRIGSSLTYVYAGQMNPTGTVITQRNISAIYGII